MPSCERTPGRRHCGRRRQRGYSLIFLVMIFTAMSILAAAALPAIEQVIRRNKEEELIFRGFQYAEAIRVFQRRYGRYPVRLAELMEVKPRCIRQLWSDPMTDDGKWGLISVNAVGTPGRPETAGQRPPGQPQLNPAVSTEEPPPAGSDTDQPQDVPRENLPILGVYSRSDKASIKMLFGKTQYKDWRFSTEVLRAPFGVGPGGSVPRVANATWIGRPFRQGLVQPGGGAMPGGAAGGRRPPGTPPGAPAPTPPPPPPAKGDDG